MNRRRGIGQLLVLLVLIAFFVYTAVFGLDADRSGSIYDIKQGLDLAGGVSITYEIAEDNPTEEEVSDTRQKLQNRVEQYSTEAEVYMEGNDRINVDIPGASDANAILEELGQPGTLVFMTEDGEVVLSGDQVENAEPYSTRDSLTNAVSYGVELTLTEEGTELFAEATAANIGNRISIIYDDNVISSPIVNQAITESTCVITNIESWDEADTLATNIRIGALPVELKEYRSTVVGAKLGEQAISRSLLAAGIAIALIMIFMIAVYRIPGVAASLALTLYIGMLIMLISTFQITLTLAGIAGVILSVGMAVDANVIIFERIREEIASGRSVKGSIKTGFQKALSAIIDGNVTTLIAAVVLYLLASGTVKGFASTLALGVILSMFTSLLITRLAVWAFYNLGFTDEKFYGKTKALKPINFTGRKKVYFIASAAVILIGAGTMIGYGVSGSYPLNFGLDFVGGTSTSVVLNEDLSIEEIHAEVLPVVNDVIDNADAQANKVTGSNEITIKTRELTLEERNMLNEALAENFGVDESEITAENISATSSREMQLSAIRAVAVALVLMLVYIWIRFRDIRFAASSILALAHDVLIVITCYALFRWSVGNTFIACLLTVLGYSINATIIVFDRIREDLKAAKGKEQLTDVVNGAITQTMRRNINTSVTTFIAVFMLYILGVSSMKAFALPLIVGVLSGAYSSMCLAGSLWILMHRRQKQVKDLELDDDE